MGVSLELYRCRIGLFSGVRLKVCSSVKKEHSSPGYGSSGLMFAGIICILLIIGGIESNPGPPKKHTCRVCNEAFAKPSLYCSHVQLHQSFKKTIGLIPCSVPTCGAKISNLGSFKSHYNLYHADKPMSVDTSQTLCVRCPVQSCTELMKSRRDYSVHMEKHLNQKVGETFSCILKGCTGTFMHHQNQFRTHNSKYHSTIVSDPFPQQVTVPVEVTLNDVINAMDISVDDVGNDYIPDGNVPVLNDDDDDGAELYPVHVIKDELARFYLSLEAVELLPTSSVQVVANEVMLVSELIHHTLKKNLRKELLSRNVNASDIEDIIFKTFSSEPVFDLHHKGRGTEQLGTDHLRSAFWKKRFKFVKPREIYLGKSESGKKKCAQFISVRESLEAMLEDPKLKESVKNSLSHPYVFPDLGSPNSVLQDFTDGSVFKDHIQCPEHDGKKCLRLFLFQDGFDPTAFSSGNCKPIGFYYSIGNLPPKMRFKLDKIQLAFMALEKDLKNSVADELNKVDRLDKALKPLIDELVDLKVNGFEMDGEKIAVCLMFLIGDSLGQNFIGRYVTNFSKASFSCRFCIMSREDFLANPNDTRTLRTPEQYDDFSKAANLLWCQRKKKALQEAKRKGDKAASKCTAPGKKKTMRDAVSRDAYKKLTAIHFKGVKYRPSPFNREELNFHVVSHQPPCLAHDLFEGLVKRVVAHILKYFIEGKKWFTFDTLNRRISSFKLRGADAADRPKPLKKIEQLSGNAVENWNFLRFAPLMFGDLIKDTEDPYWRMLLILKEAVEFICAPKIRVGQIGHLAFLIADFIDLVDEYLKNCIIPKLHYLCHYPRLICMFGPLIRLFTLRFESKHSFFKRVVKTCKNFINVTHTMARKYATRFAYDNSFAGANDFGYGNLSDIYMSAECQDIQNLLHQSGQTQEMGKITAFGTAYTTNQYVLLPGLHGLEMKVGCIKKIVPSHEGGASFILEEKKALKNSLGFYTIDSSLKIFSLVSVEDLPDYYPLESYSFQGHECISLKHSVCFMD